MDKEKTINNFLSYVTLKIIKWFRAKVRKGEYNKQDEELNRKINEMSKQKITRWHNERESGRK